MSRLASIAPWLRWVLPMAMVVMAWTAAADGPEAPLACSSGTHAWWVRSEGRTFVLEHVAAERDGPKPGVHRVADFEDRPVALAAADDQVWVAFESQGNRIEVVTARARRNPASGLWFTVPPAMRLCPSLAGEGVPSLGARGDRMLAIVDGLLQEQVGERWVSRPWPDDAKPAACRLVGTQDELWLLEALEGGRWRRWSLGAGASVAWEPRELDIERGFTPVGGGSRLAFEGGDPRRVGMLQAGVVAMQVVAPMDASLLGWGPGFAAVRLEGGTAWWAACPDGRGAFEPLSPLQPQASVAERWFHLPLLGVASLAALMLALAVRVIRRSFGQVADAGDRGAMPLPRRLAALVMDALPAGGAAWVACDAEWIQVLTPPMWSFNLGESMPFVWMTVGTVLFGTLEEAAGGRSLGKRVFGGAVIASDGGRPRFIRHLLRNLLKGLAMLSPVVALPAMVDRRGEGVAETLSGTRVVADPAAVR